MTALFFENLVCAWVSLQLFLCRRKEGRGGGGVVELQFFEQKAENAFIGAKNYKKYVDSQ